MEGILSFVVGPGGALVVMALALFGIWKFVNDRLMPFVERVFDRHLGQIDKLVENHSRMVETHGQVLDRLDDLEEATSEIKSYLREYRPSGHVV